MKTLIISAVLALGLSACAVDDRTQRIGSGAALGAGAGYLLGNGNGAATIGGAAIGGLIGNEVDRGAKERERQQYEQQRYEQQRYRRGPDGRRYYGPQY